MLTTASADKPLLIPKTASSRDSFRYRCDLVSQTCYVCVVSWFLLVKVCALGACSPLGSVCLKWICLMVCYWQDKRPATYTREFELGMQLPPELQSPFSFHLGCSNDEKKNYANFSPIYLSSHFIINRTLLFNHIYLFVFVVFVSDNPSWACCFTAGDIDWLICGSPMNLHNGGGRHLRLGGKVFVCVRKHAQARGVWENFAN